MPGLADAGIAHGAAGAGGGEPAPVPADLVRQAGRLAAQLDDVPASTRSARDFLAGQLRAMECTARRLTGQPVPFVAGGAATASTSIARGRWTEYAAAHRAGRAAAGIRTAADRMAAYRRAQEVPPERLGAAAGRAVRAAARAHPAALVPLPPGRGGVVPDRGRRAVERAAPVPRRVPVPGHGERRGAAAPGAAGPARRARGLPGPPHRALPQGGRARRGRVGRARGCWSRTRRRAWSPRAAAELGLAAVLGPGWGRVVAEVLAELGLGFDGELAERVDGADRPARPGPAGRRAAAARPGRAGRRGARPPAALAAGGRRRGPARCCASCGIRCGGPTPTTYVEGPALVRRWWDRDPGPERLRRLLDEPLTPAASGRAGQLRLAETG